MFTRRRRVRQLELCDRAMFGDLVLTCQTPPIERLPYSILSPATGKPPIIRTSSESSVKSNFTSSSPIERRASDLVDELLLDIYRNLNHSTNGYTSGTSSKSQKSCKIDVIENVDDKGPNELHRIIDTLENHVCHTGSILVRQLKRRDALRRQRDAHCDVITIHLRKRAPETADMKFTIEPAPGDSGFYQWRSAMRMVAQLPGGIPPEFRRKLWLQLADRFLSSRGVDWLKVERECFSEWSYPADAELGVQIVKDLHRTGCSLFCGEDGQENQALLKRVLLAYARWNKAVGYCQGFNMLAALILQVTEKCETDALKMMILLIEGVLPESYFADNLRGLSVDMVVFRELLRTRLPHLSRHLDALQTAAKDGTTSYEPPLTNVFTMQWFLTLFCNCLPHPTVLRVWDLILLEGNEILLRTALAIWQAVAERILSVRSADEFYCIMGVLTREMLEFGIVDANSLIKAVVTIGSLTELHTLRERYLYNINPWGSNTPSGIIEGETENEERQLKLYPKERLALDITALKKQYAKLKQRQRQAHIIFTAAVTRQPSRTPSVAINHLLLGKRALVPIRRIGPPKGAIPPVRQIPSTTTLHWKDAPRQSSSSSSSSDTELCDDPEDSEDDLSRTKTPCSDDGLHSQFQDYLNKSGDNLNFATDDNSGSGDLKKTNEITLEKVPDSSLLNLCSIADTAESNSPSFQDDGDIFDVAVSQQNDQTEESCDINKFNLEHLESIDSEDDGFDFEMFLEERVRCLKKNNSEELQEIKITEEENRLEYGRKSSQRALQIIQENSMILHRILQCQTRLTPSPPVLEKDNANTVSNVTDNNTSTQSSSKYETFQYLPTIPPLKETELKEEPICENLLGEVDDTGYLQNYSTILNEAISNNEVDGSSSSKLDDSSWYSQETYKRPSSILDSEFSKNLEEKYNKLILNASSSKVFEGGGFTKSPKLLSPVDMPKSPFREKLSPTLEGQNAIMKSPSRHYNPFPVTLSTRQNKDVPVRLGLYKK